MGKVIYLTGAPATGKSTLTRSLAQLVPGLSVFCYSEQLRDYVNDLEGTALDEVNVRRQSGKVITKAHVDAVDILLARRVEQERSERHFVIDSHPVTKEEYGFRITGFSQALVEQLAPDYVICLYASPTTLTKRIQADNQGRPLPTPYELELHNQTQISMAALYGVIAHCPTYLVDSDLPADSLAETVMSIANLR